MIWLLYSAYHDMRYMYITTFEYEKHISSGANSTHSDQNKTSSCVKQIIFLVIACKYPIHMVHIYLSSKKIHLIVIIHDYIHDKEEYPALCLNSLNYL